MKRLLFFINPNAGHAEIRSSLMEVLAIFCKGGYEPTVHMTTGPRDITRQIAERGTQYDLIVCTGGDGTLNEAVSGLMALPYEKRPPLGYIPGGTVNDVASTLGLSKDPIRAAQEIVGADYTRWTSARSAPTGTLPMSPPSASLRTCRMRRRRRTSASGAGLRIS
ncbi:MAG: diacylglycerol/lipid kinase family protein [Acutalibacteraceae bacterium]